MRIGQFGVGRIGAFHAAVLAGLDHVEELVLYDPASARAEELADRIGASVADSPQRLVDSVDATVIATPASTHSELVHMCLAAGRPTFCEKPVALDLGQMRRIVEHAEDTGTVLQVGYHRRFDAGYEAARRLRRDGALGRVYAVRMAGHDPSPPPLDYIAHSGGIFRDLHIHDFDILRHVLGQEVSEVYATGSAEGFPEFRQHNDYDTVATVLRLADGTVGVMTGGRDNRAGYDIRMEIFGSKDTVAVGLDDRTPLRSLEPGARPFAGPSWPDFQTRFEDAYRSELTAFVGVATGGSENPCTVTDAYEALRVAAAADRSVAEGRPVAVSEID